VSAPTFLIMLVTSGHGGRSAARAGAGLVDTTVLRTVDRNDPVRTSEPGEERVGVV
jgi:hypothetical protein